MLEMKKVVLSAGFLLASAAFAQHGEIARVSAAAVEAAMKAPAPPVVPAPIRPATSAPSRPVQAVLPTQQTAPRVAARTAAPATAPARASAPARTATVARAPQVNTNYSRGRSVVALSTAYNSLANQTDSTPFITATGTRTRPGVVAMSRDMLRIFPYGTRVMIEDLSGRYNFSGRVFIVEDTMHQRKTNQVDIWMASYRDAINYGRRTVRITAIR